MICLRSDLCLQASRWPERSGFQSGKSARFSTNRTRLECIARHCFDVIECCRHVSQAIGREPANFLDAVKQPNSRNGGGSSQNRKRGAVWGGVCFQLLCQVVEILAPKLLAKVTGQKVAE